MKTKKLLLISTMALCIFSLSSCSIADNVSSFLKGTPSDNTLKIVVPVDLKTAEMYTEFLNGIEIIKEEISQTEKT